MITIGKTYRKKPQYIGHMPRKTAKIVANTGDILKIKYLTGKGRLNWITIDDFERIYDTEAE